jgi:hypothetical protein
MSYLGFCSCSNMNFTLFSQIGLVCLLTLFPFCKLPTLLFVDPKPTDWLRPTQAHLVHKTFPDFSGYSWFSLLWTQQHLMTITTQEQLLYYRLVIFHVFYSHSNLYYLVVFSFLDLILQQLDNYLFLCSGDCVL